MVTPVNDLIKANLEILEKQARASSEKKDRFRANAYRKAIKAIGALDRDLASGKEAQQISGIGKKIAEKIQEIIDTGELHQVSELGTEELEKTKVLQLFGNIWGVGPVKAQELWDTGARTLDDLQYYKYQQLFNDNQKIGLKYYTDFQKRIERWQVEDIAKRIQEELRMLTGFRLKSQVCGSYRRRCADCGDMDILLTEHTGKNVLADVVDHLIKCGILCETLGLGQTKYMGVTKTPDGTMFRVDIEMIKPEEWPFALLYFTGSGQFNQNQRIVALKKGFSLSEHGLKNNKTGKYVPGIKSERDIFKFLDMDYLVPWERK